ncbi:hypothetical protein V499_07937 [Pseudogymnoascus sp. VKM F-103]|uniref:Protein-serine/threonine kinase n=1 Tax=Pseudogymnoascus verrucosus TaxID=342668 RepID=A0A1B8GJC0_9PEZI|nr:uncharacterized protein VE01_06127 [Pseudogymnoascus verrucosus]KFY71867.1 hypothetical protein V499_07937 [Pseudogymnoascus sp. VKM F-103]OBT95931.1 hypothetical protein VE01_06127 [Pseudogymnoascus verrucosus]
MLRSCTRHGGKTSWLMRSLARHQGSRELPAGARLAAATLVCSKQGYTHAAPPWRPASVLDEWVAKEARPISLRQLMVFGRSLSEARLLSSANYVRTELPVRLAHRIRDMQTLPYVVVSNHHISEVYELYYQAFENLRRIPEIKTLEENERFCKTINQTLQEHLIVIPKLAMGILECRDLMKPEDMDKFMNTILRARISRRVIAEQHLALTETYNSPWHFPDAAKNTTDSEFIGEVFLKCNAKEVVERCGKEVQKLARSAYGPDVILPDIKIAGHQDVTFPYILSHLEYIIGELLRNSIQAVVEHQGQTPGGAKPPPIEVTISEAPQHVFIRVSDQGGGIVREILPYLWSFSKGPRSEARLENLHHVPKMAATLQELRDPGDPSRPIQASHNNSLSSLSSRPPNLRLGMGLPLSRIYAEYWAGTLEIQSLHGYGVDALLQISKLGNKNEQLTTRASMDAV